jgi:hypothetical protein
VERAGRAQVYVRIVTTKDAEARMQLQSCVDDALVGRGRAE